MQHTKIKQFILLLGLILPTVLCSAMCIDVSDGHSHINVKGANVQGAPKGSTIQASIDGHYLTVTFTQDIGYVEMELNKVSGPMIFNYPSVETPDSLEFYINQTGDYIITFTLTNGDEYYGEFTVTN